MAPCICNPSFSESGAPFSQFMGTYFGECLFKEWSVSWFPFILGMISTVIWMFALMPQILANYKNKSTESLSPIFLTIWLAGDIFTFGGSLIGGQRVTMTLCGLYFCLNDCMMLFQRWYYSRGSHAASNTKKSAIALSAFVLVCGGIAGITALSSSSSASSRTLLAEPELCDAEILGMRFYVGSVISWIAGMLFFCSRIPQIVHMFRRRSVEGLAIRMFILCILANIAGSLQFLFEAGLDSQFKAKAAKWCAKTLPFVIGSAGTLIFDFIIIAMFIMFRAPKGKDVERQ